MSVTQGSRRHPALRVIVAVVLCAAAWLAIGAGTPVAGAQEVPSTPQVEAPHSIPLPNSGAEPKSATDRGGWVQEAIFFGICGAILFMLGLVILESRRKLRARAAAEAGSTQDRTSTRSEPVAESSVNSPDSTARQ